MKVLMLPTLRQFEGEESGIKRVVEAYHRYAPQFGIEFVECGVEEEDRYDLFVVHAGTSHRYPQHRPIVAMCHGLYWTSDYNANPWEWKTNASVIESIRLADVVTVPSAWVAEAISRDMRRHPVYVIPHGIEWESWQHTRINKGYVLWNKNRAADVCSPEPMVALAKMRPDVEFISTFSTKSAPGNVFPQGIVPHDDMVRLVQEAGVYLSTTKETFGIGVLEALASGTPVLGFDYGGNSILVDHGITGYLARPGNYEDLKAGLDYCLSNRPVLSRNASIRSKNWSWENAMKCVVNAFEVAVKGWQEYQLPLRIDESLYHTGGD